MDALVLAAGRGTRLRPLTNATPKPALPVRHAPMIRFALRAVGEAGATRVFINVHHAASALVDLRPRLEAWVGCPVEFLREESLLGTAGTLAKLAPRVRSSALLVVNGDVLLPPLLSPLVRAHAAEDSVATMLVTTHARTELARSVCVDGRRVVGVRVRGRTSAQTRRVVFCGAHVLSPAALTGLPPRGDVVEEGYWRWLEAGRAVGIVETRAPWDDLGTIARYAEGQLWPADDFVDGPDVHPEADVPARTRVGPVVAGPGSVALPGARLDQVVLMPGARAQGALRRCVVPAAGAPIAFS